MKTLERALIANQSTPSEVLHDLTEHPDPEVTRHLAFHRNLSPESRAVLKAHKDPLTRQAAHFDVNPPKVREAGLALAREYSNAAFNLVRDSAGKIHREHQVDKLAHRVSHVLETHSMAMRAGGWHPDQIRHTMEAAHAYAVVNGGQNMRHPAINQAFEMAHLHQNEYEVNE